MEKGAGELGLARETTQVAMRLDFCSRAVSFSPEGAVGHLWCVDEILMTRTCQTGPSGAWEVARGPFKYSRVGAEREETGSRWDARGNPPAIEPEKRRRESRNFRRGRPGGAPLRRRGLAPTRSSILLAGLRHLGEAREPPLCPFHVPGCGQPPSESLCSSVPARRVRGASRARPCGRGAGAMLSAAQGRRREGGMRVSADRPLSPVPPVSSK